MTDATFTLVHVVNAAAAGAFGTLPSRVHDHVEILVDALAAASHTAEVHVATHTVCDAVATAL